MGEDKKHTDEGYTSDAEEGEVLKETDAPPKHPLEHRWTLWFDNPAGKQDMKVYGQTLKPVYTFGTVEEFWCLYNNVRPPGQLQPNANATFYLFKEDVEPKWEHTRNVGGGCWTASVPQGANAKQTLDTWWLHAMLACIGEQFDEWDEINGIGVVLRRGRDRLELWTQNASNEAAQMSVGRQFKQVLDIPESAKIAFSVFADKMSNKKGKDKYMV